VGEILKLPRVSRVPQEKSVRGEVRQPGDFTAYDGAEQKEGGIKERGNEGFLKEAKKCEPRPTRPAMGEAGGTTLFCRH